MNIFLQIGLGLLPGAAVAIIILIKRRAFNIGKIILTALIAVCSVALIIAGLSLTAKKNPEKNELSAKQMMITANALAEEGAFEEAGEVIDQYSKVYGYDDECRLITARIALLEGDYEKAETLYKYLSENTDLISAENEEVQIAGTKSVDHSSDRVMISYLESIGEDISEYGYSNMSKEEIYNNSSVSEDVIKNSIVSAIKEKYKFPDEMLRYAEAISGVSKSYEENPDYYPGNYEYIFNEIEENAPEFLELDCINKARIKSYVHAGDFSAITKNLEDDSSYHELMIAAELYMSGLVGQNDFADMYNEIGLADEAIIKIYVQKIYEKYYGKMTVQEEKAFDARISAILRQLDDPLLATLKEQLKNAAEGKAGADRTKVYLELAKIEHYFGNDIATDNDLSEAIYSSQDNKDDSYVAAMSQIISVINNDESSASENIKNVSEYVDNVLDHSLTVNVEQIVSPQYNGDSAGDFAQTATDYVSRAKSAISIGMIDTSSFEKDETITARVVIDSKNITDPKELKAALKVYDCGALVPDFEFEKIEYDEANIILLCDVSGSMSGSIQDLRDAVVTFITDKNPDENLAVITFNSSIVESKIFGTPDDELIEFAQNMRAGGGTDMFSAAKKSLDWFTADEKSNNVLILMTDGQDNYPRDEETIEKELGEYAVSKGTSIYTLGLGSDVDTVYLETIADSGNGGFVYVSDSSSLTSFYDMLHAQMHSLYKIKFKVQDNMTMTSRTLEVNLPSEKVRDVKTYSIGDYYSDEDVLKVDENTSIIGINPKYIYKGLQDVEVKLKGTGFKEDNDITVKLNGNMDYTLEAKYVDDRTYSLKVPHTVAAGVYNVEITINGKRKILTDGFCVVYPGTMKTTEFGPYVFKSTEKIVNGENNYTLRGFVTLNDWLHFKGDINIVGDLKNGTSIKVSDYNGSYVEFDESAEGLATYYYENDIDCPLPALYDFTLYNDIEHKDNYDEYRVDPIPTGLLEFFDFIKIDKSEFRLYPDSFGMYFGTGNTIFPYQKQIVKTKLKKEFFTFDFNAEARLTDKNLGFIINFDYSELDSNFNHQLNFLDSPVYFNGSLKLRINTLKNEYTVGFMTRLAFLAKQSGLGAEVSWKGQLIPDSVKISLELARAVMLPTTIPIELNNFAVKVSEINEAVKTGNFFKLMLSGYATISTGKVKELVPFLEPFIGNISVFEMPDTEISLRACPFTAEAKADLYFLSEIKLAEAEIHIGTFDFTNSLLGLKDEEVGGLMAKVKAGIMWDTADDRIHLDISGTVELDLHSRFVGLYANGTMEYDIGWWLIRTGDRKTGSVAIGLYTTHSGKQELILALRGQDGNEHDGVVYYIDDNGHIGSRNGELG